MSKFLVLATSIFLASMMMSEGEVAAQSRVKLVGHLASRAVRNSRGSLCNRAVPGCQSSGQLSVVGEIGTGYTLYLLALDAEPGVSGIQFWISYPRKYLKVLDWFSCAATQIPLRSPDGENWPLPDSGIRLVFENEVQRANSANGNEEIILGTMYVYAYAAASFRFKSYEESSLPWESQISVVASDYQTNWVTVPDNVGSVSFGSSSGYSPCGQLVDEVSEKIRLERTHHPLVLSPPQANPASSRASWTITSTHDRDVEVRVYSVAGRVVRTHNLTWIRAGVSVITWDGRDDQGVAVPAGQYYLVVVSSDGYKAIQNVVLLD